MNMHANTNDENAIDIKRNKIDVLPFAWILKAELTL